VFEIDNQGRRATLPLVTDYQAVREIYQEAAETGVALPAFCAEDRETLEAILGAALEYGRTVGVVDLPIVPAWTVRYPPRAQMRLLTRCGDPLLGTQLMFSDLQAFAGKDSPYRRLRIMPHLDHAFPWLDGDVLEHYADAFASVMCDASEKPLDENIRLTAYYAERIRGRAVLEGAVDEIYESASGAEKNTPTTAEQATRFVRETGVDLIVPNVGTEHRSTADKVEYLSARAQEISGAVGNVLCLHGTSSLRSEDLASLPEDGFVKVNIYTILAVRGGQAVARWVLSNLANLFDGQQLRELAREGLIGEARLPLGRREDTPPAKPKLDYVCNPRRRDEWFDAVKTGCLGFMGALGYWRFAG
jgi:fructose-bisphosphate aldolase class II